MKIKARRAGLAALVVAVLAGCQGGAATGDEPGERATAGPSARVPASPEAPPEGERLSSGALQSRWWTWAASEPERTNPVADPDGSSCGRNQPRDVWFLAGTFGTQVRRTCTVPGGVRLAFPVVNSIGTSTNCADFMRTAKGTAVLDGRRLGPEVYQGDEISVQAAAGNPITESAGRFTTTGCGVWVQLPPLAPGRHTLTIRGESAGFSVGVDYSLDVGSASGAGSASA